ncbi:Siderophore-interacting protein [Mycobacteroides abscessus subsp. abscessus]|nr:Siderophore-interacting protein [Mycobacteroides abscessus subsp. abscessus]
MRLLEREPERMRGRALLSALREELGLVPRAAEEDAAGIAAQRAEPGELVWGRAEESEDPAGVSVWLAAEAAVVRAARRVCVNEAGIDRRRISFMGYWKAGQAES